MADALTGTPTGGEDTSTTLDFLGRRAPISFQGQPALPQVGGGPASLAATPSPSVAGAGVLAPPTSFGDVAQSINRGPGMEQGGDGGPGGSSSEGSPGASVGGQLGGLPSFGVASGPFSVTGSPFGITGRAGPATLGVGPTGLSAGVSAKGLTGFDPLDTALDFAMSAGKGLIGVPTSLSPALLSALTHAPAAVGAIASALSLVGIPFSLVALAHTIASMSPTSVFSLQEALSKETGPLPLSLTPEQMAAVALGGARGPTVGGVQAPSGVPGQYGGLNMPDNFYTGFPQAPQMLGREDVPEGPPAAPTAEGPGISGAPPGGAIGQGNPTGLGEGVGPGGVSGPPGDTGPGVGPGDAAGDF